MFQNFQRLIDILGKFFSIFGELDVAAFFWNNATESSLSSDAMESLRLGWVILSALAASV